MVSSRAWPSVWCSRRGTICSVFRYEPVHIISAESISFTSVLKVDPGPSRQSELNTLYLADWTTDVDSSINHQICTFLWHVHWVATAWWPLYWHKGAKEHSPSRSGIYSFVWQERFTQYAHAHTHTLHCEHCKQYTIRWQTVT